jgi:hypothetical protein
MGTSHTAATKSQTGPLPLVIGITGHRDLRQEDHEALAARIRDVIVDLQCRYPQTPLVLLSPLAEGADRLAARVALACGMRLVAPLPLPKGIYEADFQSSESVKEFHDLLHQASSWFELPMLPASSKAADCPQGEARDRQYAFVGAFIARHCQILLALWDGVTSEAEGGTAQVVRFKLQGVPERYAQADEVQSPLDPVDSGPVYHILTPRASNPSPAGPACRLAKLFPSVYEREAMAEAAYDRIYAHMNAFNRDVLRLGDALVPAREQSQAYVIPPSQAEDVPHALKYILVCYGTADALALAFQRRTLLTLRALLALSVVATIFFQLYGQVENKPWELAAGYLSALGAAYAWYMWAKRHDYDNKYLDYRALAEGLRVQFFWRLAGLRHAVADHYLRKQRGELDWIRQALRVWSLIGWEASPAANLQPTPAAADSLRLILKHWVEDQYVYFSKVALREQAKFQRIKKVSYAFFLVGLAMGMIKMFLSPDHPILVAIGIAVILAALLLGYAKSRALSEHAKQYGRMSIIFANAKRHLEECIASERTAEARALVEELGKEALAENGDWVLLHRERPIQVPKS